MIWLVRFQGRKCLEKAHESSQAPVREMLLGGRFRRGDLRIQVGHENKIHEIYERKWKQYLSVRLFHRYSQTTLYGPIGKRNLICPSKRWKHKFQSRSGINPLNTELNPICQ